MNSQEETEAVKTARQSEAPLTRSGGTEMPKAKRRTKLFQDLPSTPLEDGKLTITLTLEQHHELFNCAARGASAMTAYMTDSSDATHLRSLDYNAWRRSFEAQAFWSKTHLKFNAAQESAGDAKSQTPAPWKEGT